MKVVPSTSIYCYKRIKNTQLLAELKKKCVPCIIINMNIINKSVNKSYVKTTTNVSSYLCSKANICQSSVPQSFVVTKQLLKSVDLVTCSFITRDIQPVVEGVVSQGLMHDIHYNYQQKLHSLLLE